MNALFTEPFLVSLLFGAVTAGLPLLLAGLGEQISEKAGVLNIGLEGMMLLGAYTGFLATYHTGSFWLGFLAGGAGGMGAALIVLLSVHTQGAESDRHRHRHYGGSPGSDLAAAFRPVQPLVSAPCRGAGVRAARA